MRTFENDIYLLIRLNKQLDEIDAAFNSIDFDKLNKIFENSGIRKLQQESKLFNEIDLNEASIRDKYNSTIKILMKKSIELQYFPCISCEKLKCENKIKKLSKYENKIGNPN